VEVGELRVVDDTTRRVADRFLETLNGLLVVASTLVAPGERLLQLRAIDRQFAQWFEMLGGIAEASQLNGQMPERLASLDVVGGLAQRRFQVTIGALASGR